MDPKTASIFLKAPLDYEKMQFYQFKIIAVDGYGLNSSEVLTIRILDIQDTPPEVQGTPYVVTVQENSPLGKHFFTCRAIDGDRGIPNEVAFSFSTETPCQSLFAINETSGEITVSGDVDRDFGDVMEHGGVCNMEIFVREIEQPAHAQFGLTESRAALSVFVTDENDNAPSISADSFRAYIDNTAELNYPIQFENDTEIFIEDKDQGSSGILELVLRGEDGDMTYDFEPIPSVIASRGAPLIALKSPDLIKRRGNITLKLYAIERDTAERNSATAVIHIRVTPVETTTPIPTSPPTTTERYKDPFIPSLIGAIIPCLLLIWVAAATCYYCIKRRGVPRNNRIGHQNVSTGKELHALSMDLHTGHPPPAQNGAQIGADSTSTVTRLERGTRTASNA
ncbi:cadherin-related family member 1-like [Mya arenaria]|uniref:cadherin-related family member 1-like n=1 Tax=Mya arenaria TaxID=6604 RepID=UPI0022E3A7E7|nr:cadherin-related family member 1-like [Mya arenaria]